MNSRRRILVNPRLQGKIIAVFVGTALVCFAVQMTLQVMAITTAVSTLPPDPNAASRYLVETILLTSSVGVLLLVPLSICAGMLVTFRIAGPIYRIESYLDARLRGEDQGLLKIRDGDECQKLVQLLNQVINTEKTPAAPATEDTSEDAQLTSTSQA